jgi:formate hydrogenlyase subunit 6/NADH:ubiquinone oxidoreductase subunit I
VVDIRIMRERCVACGDCVDLCPQSGPGREFPVLVVDESGEVSVASSEGCIACFSCCEFCRSAAITITNAEGGLDGQPDIYPTRPTSRII